MRVAVSVSASPVARQHIGLHFSRYADPDIEASLSYSDIRHKGVELAYCTFDKVHQSTGTPPLTAIGGEEAHPVVPG